MARGGEDFASWQDWLNCHQRIKTDHLINDDKIWRYFTIDERHICYTYQTNYKRHRVKISTLKSQSIAAENRVYETTQTNSWMRKFAEHTYETTFYGSESSNSRRTSKHLKERLQKFCELDNEYELGLTANEIFSPAFEYAKAKAASERKWTEIFESVEGIAAAVMVIVAVVLMFVPGGQGGSGWLATKAAAIIGVSASTLSTAANVIAAVAIVAAYAGSLYYQHTAAKAQGEAASASRYHSASAALKAKQEAEEAKAQLTALMIYGGYEIYANGSIYKKGAAGSQTFNSQIAFDANKGILGQIKQDEFGEQLQGRYGGKLGGGEYFHQNLMQVDFPLQKFSYGIEQKMDMLEKRLKRNVVRVANGFNKLFENYFNADENGAATYERVYNLHTKPIKTSMKSEAFLDTLKCYSRDEMQTFNYINQATFRERKENTDPIYIYFNSETYKAYMDDEEIGSYLKHGYSEDEARKMLFEKKIITYLQNLRLVFDYIQDCEESGNLITNLEFVYSTTAAEKFALNEKQSNIENYYTDENGNTQKTTIATSQSVSFLGQTYYTFGYNTTREERFETDGTLINTHKISGYHHPLKADTGEAMTIADFDLFGGYFKEDFDKENLTGDKMIEFYKNAISRLIMLKVRDAVNVVGEVTKYFFLIRENKSYKYINKMYNANTGEQVGEISTGKTEWEYTATNEFFAVEIPQAAFECYSVPLYIPEKLKADFETYDFSSVKGFL